MRKSVKLYNVIFPVWLLIYFVPVLWIIVLPLNLVIDGAVIYLCLKKTGVKNIKENLKASVLKTWGYGFAADAAGALCMLSLSLIPSGLQSKYSFIGDMLFDAHYNPFNNIFAFVFTALCVFISGILIYGFNLEFCFGKTTLTEHQKKYTALRLAIFTAPYLFFFPTSILF